jgi:hypothetical protein
MIRKAVILFLILAFLTVLTLDVWTYPPKAHAATSPGVTLSANPLGVNVSPRQSADPIYKY